MNDDELLRRLAEAAREEERTERERLDPRWDELAAGSLSEEDEAALRRTAEESMEAKRALEAFTPLGAEFRARVVREARERIGAADATGGASRAEPARRPFRSPERTRPRIARWVAAAALAAGLAAVALWPEAGPLPAYQAVLAGAVRAERGPGDAGEVAAAWPAAIRFAPGNRFELLLRPETTVRDEIEAGTFRQDGGTLVPWPLPRETAEGGAVRISGTVGREVRLPEGEGILVAVVGRRGELPAAAEVLAGLGESGRAAGEDWQAWRWRLELVPAVEP